MPDRLSHEVIGNESGPTVAMLHGMLSSNRQWTPNLDALGASCRLVLIEAWGHGSSPVPTDPAAYEIEGLIEAIDGVRREVGVGSWSLIGYSYGGALALQYALRRPTRTTSVVFTNSRAAMGSPTAEDCARNSAAFLAGPGARELPYHPIHAGRLPAALRDALVESADGASPEAVAALMRTAWQVSVHDRLGELSVPVTLVNGRFEKAFQPFAAQIRAEQPQIDVFDVDAGHAVNMQAVDDFNTIALRALLAPPSRLAVDFGTKKCLET